MLLLVIFGLYQAVVNNFCCKWIVNRGVFLFVLLLFSFSVLAQAPNSWIDFSQSYYKIPVSKDGIYKLTYSDLQAAGFPVSSVDPRRIQIFHRGVEQAIFIQGQADAALNTNDYLEFYGKKNDGTRDANLYKPSSLQPHSYYNIYSDTAAYFLTWNFTSQGKRMPAFSEVNVSNLPKESFQHCEKLLVVTDQYSGGYTQNDVMQYTQFDKGEGWTGIALRQGQAADYALDLLTNPVQSGGLPQLEVLLVGRDNISHTAEIYVGSNVGSLRLVNTSNFLGFETLKVTASLNWTDIGADGKMIVRVGAAGTGTQRFQFSSSYIKINFPQSFDLLSTTEKTIRLPINSGGKSYIELVNPNANQRLWDVTDSNNVLIIGTQNSGGLLSAVIANTQATRILYANTVTLTPVLKPISFRPIQPASHNYLIITHRSLLKPAGGYTNVVEAYASYRATSEGGGYDTLIVTVDQLYNQFNYGETSSLAIYEFVKFMVNGGSPKYLFLIGKARDVYSHRKAAASSTELKDLVPAAGAPGADIAFSAGISGTVYEPALPTGRLTATKPEQVAAYLNKVKEIESSFNNPDEIVWRKEGLHLSGGIQPFELIYFKDIVNSFKTIAEDYYWGSKITTLSKRDPNPVEVINISEEINKGVNMITFFGHSSPNTIDIDIGYVTDPTLGYNNPGKYPVFLINGCNAGNSLANGISFGEDWMMAANKGARNFIAHSSFGFVNTLQQYSDYFYRIGFGDSTFIAKGIGDVQKEVAKRYIESNGASMPAITQVQQMLLLGDPAMKLFGTSNPDYETNDNSIFLESIDGSPVTALSDSFAVKVIVRNYGAARETPLQVKLSRKFSDGSSMDYVSTFSSPFFQDTLKFILYKPKQDGSGSNEFLILLDPEDELKELSKSNNSAKLIINIPSNGTKNLYPLPYAIVSSTTVDFIFQDTDLLSAKRDYQIEIDTVSSFNSPYVRKIKLSGKVLAKLLLNLLPVDSMVYYWRTKFAQPKEGESLDWVNASFTYIKDSPEGWAQSETGQLTENKLTDIIIDPINGFKFSETTSDVFVRTFGSNNPTPYTSVSVKINNAEYNLGTQGQPCRNNTINLIAFKKATAVPYAGIPFNFQDPRTCGREPQLINSFTVSEIETGLNNDLLSYVDNIGVSDSVLIFSIGNPGYSTWSSNVLNKLIEFGVSPTDIALLEQGEPLVIFGRKGANAGTAKVFTTAANPKNEQELQVIETITGRAAYGKMSSVLIGPAQSWSKFIPRVSVVEASDSYSFSIFGVKPDGTDSLIQENIVLDVDLSSVNAIKYPYTRVELFTNDEINLTPVQLKNWMVIYEPTAEGILMHNEEPEVKEIQEGAPWSDQFKFVNISNKNFSTSLTAEIEVFNRTKLTKEVQKIVIDAPAKYGSTIFTLLTSTISKVGFNDLSVFVNRKIVPEQYYDNNGITLKDYIIITPDHTRPLLDVTIDGRYLQNFDYVSPNPMIRAVVKDENPFLFKSDTIGVNIFLRSPCGASECDFVRINFNSGEITWTPATATSNFKVEYKPKSLADGVYALEIEATDATGNKSGSEPYQITFQVKNETTFNFKSVFPNPSSEYFYFQFQLTGNTLPDYFDLQIFTTDGRLVQKFTQADVNDFKLGVNELIWQAYDLSGCALPNGMYLYRMRISSRDVEAQQQGKLILSR